MGLIRHIEYMCLCDSETNCDAFIEYHEMYEISDKVGTIKAKHVYPLWRSKGWKNKGKLWYCPKHISEAE